MDSSYQIVRKTFPGELRKASLASYQASLGTFLGDSEFLAVVVAVAVVDDDALADYHRHSLPGPLVAEGPAPVAAAVVYQKIGLGVADFVPSVAAEIAVALDRPLVGQMDFGKAAAPGLVAPEVDTDPALVVVAYEAEIQDSLRTEASSPADTSSLAFA